MVFKKINTIFLRKNKFSLYFLFTALKVCWKFVANFQSNFQGGVASLTETFNANLQGWIESFNANFQGWIASLKKLAGLHWNFHANFQCSPASFFKLSIQPWKFALKLSIQPCKFALKVSVKLATPLKVWLKVCNKLSTNFQGSKQKI